MNAQTLCRAQEENARKTRIPEKNCGANPVPNGIGTVPFFNGLLTWRSLKLGLSDNNYQIRAATWPSWGLSQNSLKKKQTPTGKIVLRFISRV
jgi:hypothetical protein